MGKKCLAIIYINPHKVLSRPNSWRVCLPFAFATSFLRSSLLAKSFISANAPIIAVFVAGSWHQRSSELCYASMRSKPIDFSRLLFFLRFLFHIPRFFFSFFVWQHSRSADKGIHALKVLQKFCFPRHTLRMSNVFWQICSSCHLRCIHNSNNCFMNSTSLCRVLPKSNSYLQQESGAMLFVIHEYNSWKSSTNTKYNLS